jgi:hypothetical protein
VAKSRKSLGYRCCCGQDLWQQVPGAEKEVKPLGTSLFCWSFMLPGGTDEPLMRLQIERQTGIFACEDHGVVSTQKMWLSESISTMTVGDDKLVDSWHNSEVFVAAWELVLGGDGDEGRALSSEWVVKADPDAVFLPSRLKRHLAPHLTKGPRLFVANCNVPKGTSKLYGAIEVFSRGALQMYRAASEQCRIRSDWKDLGEDLYMQDCMQELNITKIEDFKLVGDGRCHAAPCTDSNRVAFHPFKDVHSYTSCLGLAMK